MDKQKLEDELEDLEILLPQLNSAYAEMQVEEFDFEWLCQRLSIIHIPSRTHAHPARVKQTI